MYQNPLYDSYLTREISSFINPVIHRLTRIMNTIEEKLEDDGFPVIDTEIRAYDLDNNRTLYRGWITVKRQRRLPNITSTVPIILYEDPSEDTILLCIGMPLR